MAFKMISHEWCCVRDAYINSYILDSANDVANLPKCAPGSTAMVAAKGGAIYMVNASGSWEEL